MSNFKVTVVLFNLSLFFLLIACFLLLTNSSSIQQALADLIFLDYENCTPSFFSMLSIAIGVPALIAAYFLYSSSIDSRPDDMENTDESLLPDKGAVDTFGGNSLSDEATNEES